MTALAICQKLADDNPAVPYFRSILADSHCNLGDLLKNTGKSSEAEAEHRIELAIRQKLADENPAIPQYQRELAYSLGSIGGCLHGPERRARRSVTTRGNWRSIRSSPRPARHAPQIGIPWRTARPKPQTCSVGQGDLTRRSPPAIAPWRCASLWPRRIPSARATARASAKLTCVLGRCDATRKTAPEPLPPGSVPLRTTTGANP